VRAITQSAEVFSPSIHEQRVIPRNADRHDGCSSDPLEKPYLQISEILLSLLPVGLMQTYQSVANGYWSARSPEFLQTDLMQTLRWLRMIGDTIFAIGAGAFVYFALDLMWRRKARVKAPATGVALADRA
jgi:hypothetical protein